MPEYKPPASLESEQTVLGVILLYPEKLQEIIEIIRPEDFYRTAHGVIYQAMLDLLEADTPIELVTLYSHLKEKGRIEEVGGMKFLIGLKDEVGPANFKYHVQVVHDKSTLRRLQAIAVHIGAGCSGNGAKPGELIEYASNQVRDLAEAANIKKPKKIAEIVQDWAMLTTGDFLMTDLYRDLNIMTKVDKWAATQAISRMGKEGKLVKYGSKRGRWRLAETDYESIDHFAADDTPMDIILPFGLHKHIEWFQRGMGVIAGDTDSGKTTLFLNMAHDNKGKFKKIIYIATEMGGPLLKRRLKKLCEVYGYPYPEAFAHVDFREPKTQNYMDLVEPDALTLIDYYELTDNFYLVAGYFRQIFEKLTTGTVFIGLQKKFGSPMGRAGEFAMEKPLLYIALHRGNFARIEKCKTEWTPQFQPYAIEYKYEIVAGGRLTWQKRLRGKLFDK